jgi:hypothetical protein
MRTTFTTNGHLRETIGLQAVQKLNEKVQIMSNLYRDHLDSLHTLQKPAEKFAFVEA